MVNVRRDISVTLITWHCMVHNSVNQNFFGMILQCIRKKKDGREKLL